jgi:hypothetical protein
MVHNQLILLKLFFLTKELYWNTTLMEVFVKVL